MLVNRNTGAPYCTGCGREMEPVTECDRAKRPTIDYICRTCPAGYTNGAPEQCRLADAPLIEVD